MLQVAVYLVAAVGVVFALYAAALLTLTAFAAGTRLRNR